jgi:hypothetical protein
MTVFLASSPDRSDRGSFVPLIATEARLWGVKNRAELDDCLAAEAAGPLTNDEMREIATMRV